MSNRRSFLKISTLLTSATVLCKPAGALASISKSVANIENRNKSVFIYHTNDLHGNLSSNADGIGGLKQMQSMISSEETSGIVVDAGDFFSPDFVSADHQTTISLMNRMGYHAAAIGNNELKHGQEHLAKLIPLMEFSLVNCNYIFTHSALAKKVERFTVLSAGNLKIGITGVGHDLKQQGIQFLDPYVRVNEVASYLKHTLNCDIVICLSHLGFDDPDFNSKELAERSADIDFVASGHGTKTLPGLKCMKNLNGYDVFLNQAGANGHLVGKFMISFNSRKQKSGFDYTYKIPGLAHSEYANRHYALVRKEMKKNIPEKLA